MSRNFKNFLWFMLGMILIFAGTIPLARAESIPATNSIIQSTTSVLSYYYSTQTFRYPTVEAVCTANSWLTSAAWATKYNSGVNPYGSNYCVTDVNKPNHTARLISSQNTCPNTPTGWTQAGSVCNLYSYSCPTSGGWTLSGSSCSRPDCPAGRNADGSCQPVCTPPAVLNSSGTECTTTCPAGQVLSSSGCIPCTNVSGGSGQTYHYQKLSDGGACLGAAGQTGCVVPSGSGVTVCIGSGCTGQLGTGTGQNCLVPQSGSPATDPNTTGQTDPVPADPTNPATKCAQSGLIAGTVNGTTVCVSPTSTPVQSTSTQTKTDPSGNVTVQKTTKTCVGTDCTSSTTTTVNGVSQGTSTVSGSNPMVGGAMGESEDLNDVLRACNERPDLPICTDFCSKPENSEFAMCQKLGTAPDTDQLGTKELGVSSITEYSFGSAGTCPGPIALPHNASLSFDWICQLLEAVKPMLLALAWLSAGMIVIGAARNG